MCVREQSMTERSAQNFGAEVVDTVVKSGLTGVAATVLAAAIFSPAGLGGMIGTSLALGGESNNSSNASQDPYSVLPAYPAPLSAQELDTIHTQLAQSAASLEFTRAATNDRIERMRSLAVDADDLVTFEPTRTAQAAPREALRLSLSEPVSAPAPTPAPVEAMPISYGGAVDTSVPYRDPHLELAELFLAHAPY
jgi:hypothetical protein